MFLLNFVVIIRYTCRCWTENFRRNFGFFFEWKYVLLLVRPYVPTQKLVLTQFNCLFLRFFFFILYFLVILHDHARVRYSAKYFIFSMPVDSFIIRSTLFSLKMCVVFFLSSQSLLWICFNELYRNVSKNLKTMALIY